MRVMIVCALALVVALPAWASEQRPTQSELEAELVCPACKAPLDESHSPIAQQIKAYIRKHIEMGWTKSQIADALEEQLGPSVIGVPRKHGFDLLAWVLPLAVIGTGAIALAGGAWAWSRNRGAPTGADTAVLDPDLDRRVDDALARFDG